MLTLNFAKRGSYGAVEARLVEALQQIPLEHVNAPFRSVRPAVLRDESIKRHSLVQPDPSPHQQMRGNPAQEERDTWTQSYADQHPRRSKATFVGSDERTAQEPFRWLACLQLDGDCRGAVGDDPDRRRSLRRDNPEASDKSPQPVGGFVESDFRALDESGANTHPFGTRASDSVAPGDFVARRWARSRAKPGCTPGLNPC